MHNLSAHYEPQGSDFLGQDVAGYELWIWKFKVEWKISEWHIRLDESVWFFWDMNNVRDPTTSCKFITAWNALLETWQAAGDSCIRPRTHLSTVHFCIDDEVQHVMQNRLHEEPLKCVLVGIMMCSFEVPSQFNAYMQTFLLNPGQEPVETWWRVISSISLSFTIFPLYFAPFMPLFIQVVN